MADPTSLPTDPTSPLYQLRRRLAQTLAPTQTLVPLTTMAAACGVSPQTWRRAESKPTGLSASSRDSIRVALAALGYRVTNAQLLGESPLPDPPAPTQHPQSTLAALHAMLTATTPQTGAPNNPVEPLQFDVDKADE